MPTINYITPITDRTYSDVEYARQHQNDLLNKNKGAWNYSDINRICNNLKYAAEYMYEQGFLDQPYSMQIKLDWKETDIITYETLNSMIIDNMNNLKTYSRNDLPWYPIIAVANIDYVIANYIEKNIDSLAKQKPIPPDTYRLTVKNGSGTGDYEANTIVKIQANPPDEGMIFDRWSGDHLENIGSATAAITTYTMPHENITLTANYTGTIPHTLRIVTNTKTEEVRLSMGEIYYIEADPAPNGKVFYNWDVSPNKYDDNLYEPAATTHFTMPNEDVVLTAIYITKGEKQLIVNNGNGSGWYEYNSYVAISSNKPANTIFTNWTGDTQYLTRAATEEYNSIKIPDMNKIEVTAHWTKIFATNVPVTIVNGIISSTNSSQGTFTEGNKLTIVANPAPEDQVFFYWKQEGAGNILDENAKSTVFTVGESEVILTAVYRNLEYHDLTVITHKGSTVRTLEAYDYFSVNAEPYPEGQTFNKWTGNVSTFNQEWPYMFEIDNPQTGTYMGLSDRTITATYRMIATHTLTVKQLSGDTTYTQSEFTTVKIVAEEAPTGKRFVRWKLNGEGTINGSDTSSNIVFEFGDGDAVLTPIYVNIWTISVINGTINGKETALLDEGETYYYLRVRSLAVYERFDGWTQTGPGTIYNAAATMTRFTVGNGDAVLTANISQYPDKTLTVSWRDPNTGIDTIVSQETYTYGTRINNIVAKVAPNQTTFLTWLGDVDLLRPSALASSVYIDSLTADTNIIATYYYPESPEYYALSIYDGYPEEGVYPAGSQIEIRAKNPSQGWEFYKWYGDTQYLVNPDLTLSENAIIMPQKAITLYAKFTVIGELPLFRISVINGIASGTYYTGEGETQQEHAESGTYIDVPAGIEITLTADPDTVGWVFDHWSGNFEQAGVTDIIKTNNPTVFTSVDSDLNITMVRRELDKYIIYTTNATGPGEVYPGVYPIVGSLIDTDNYHYNFLNWTCVDADKVDCITSIENPNSLSTNITVTDRSLWIEAIYKVYYKLTVIKGQDTGTGYYAEEEIITTVHANEPEPESHLQFDHWDDPMGIIQNIYDPTPIIIMKNTIATITAVFISIDAKGNSIAITSEDIHDSEITRHDSYLINGIYTIGTIVFDKDGCIGVITEIDPDQTDDTDDYKVEKLFYGGNF